MNSQTFTHVAAPVGSNLAETQSKRQSGHRYDAALASLQPLLSNPESLKGAGFYRALNQLQKTYPELTGNEIEALVTAVLRGLQNHDDATG